MLIDHVHVQVKPESVQAFKAASLDNARHSVQEPGIARFDVVQQVDDPARFASSRAIAPMPRWRRTSKPRIWPSGATPWRT